ncbi:hypothetical protein [Spirosoma aerophilum]
MATIKAKSISSVFSKESIDVFISSSSFEDRCFEIPRHLDFEIKHTLIFFNSNEEQKIITNANLLTQLFHNNVKSVDLSSDDPIGNYIKIHKSLLSIFSHKGLNLFVDTTTFTHETLLVLLKIICLNKTNFNKVIFGYVGAKDYSYNTVIDNDKWLSKGIKEIRTILGYPGYTDPTLKNHLIILFGFESERTEKLIEYYEFNKVSLGFVSLGNAIQSNHYKINYERHCLLLDRFPFAEKFEFSLIDPVVTKKNILALVQNNSDYNSVVAPMNNKISTIGAGLAAIENADIQLSYAKPLLYNSKAYSISNGVVHYFKLRL